ncbi:hypothetical protein [Streptomyces sp. NPDC059761]|uniref:hypothetical protein n=1 Tax=Streptomyces sp. NPDC059761 TaxID=3346937 RepID=UPI00365EF35C
MSPPHVDDASYETDQWSPPSHAYWCTYCRAWTHIKYVQPERHPGELDKLNVMLDTCD